MQFHALTILTVLVATSGTLANVVCTIHAFADNTNKAGLHTCLDGYRTDNWDGMDCGGRGWFKGTHKYKSPQDCYDACNQCINSAIDAGASDVECDDYEGGTYCWLGYH
ncbi:hypothetical protein HGRIS_004600 [Hohenbuehelia grisea]|uniref:Uncharacterized protein n=1 Tax=Hohenbuehelia grisea TaxID=104357 RepID=A0ABR3JD78_9AGAR